MVPLSSIATALAWAKASSISSRVGMCVSCRGVQGWWQGQDLNLRPLVHETSELTGLLYPAARIAKAQQMW